MIERDRQTPAMIQRNYYQKQTNKKLRRTKFTCLISNFVRIFVQANGDNKCTFQQ